MSGEASPPPTVDDGDFGDTLPTLYVSRFFMRAGSVGSRISFGELVNLNAPTNWRVAMLAGNEDWEALAHLILNMLGKTHPASEPSAGASAEASSDHGKE